MTPPRADADHRETAQPFLVPAGKLRCNGSAVVEPGDNNTAVNNLASLRYTVRAPASADQPWTVRFSVLTMPIPPVRSTPTTRKQHYLSRPTPTFAVIPPPLAGGCYQPFISSPPPLYPPLEPWQFNVSASARTPYSSWPGDGVGHTHTGRSFVFDRSFEPLAAPVRAGTSWSTGCAARGRATWPHTRLTSD